MSFKSATSAQLIKEAENRIKRDLTHSIIYGGGGGGYTGYTGYIYSDWDKESEEKKEEKEKKEQQDKLKNLLSTV